MKRNISFLSLTLVVLAISSSCTKKTETKIVEVEVEVATKDTTLNLTAKGWDAFSFETLALMDSGASTYFTTSEGVKFYGQAYRLGARLQTKTALRFGGKSLYYKWKGNGGGQFAAFVAQIKYDPLTNDGDPAIQGVDLTFFTLKNSFNESIQIQEDTWYYTRVSPVSGTDNFQVVTSTGNYSNKGGQVIETTVIPIYTKAGYLAFRMGDSYSTNAYAILGEMKIAD